MEKKFENKPVTRAAGFAGWLEDFVKALAPKKEIIAEANDDNEIDDKVAEINVKDLPKVIWNDETFYVTFDDQGATVLNEFGNTVTKIDGVKSIEDVDKTLNSNQIVAEEVQEENLEVVGAEVETDDNFEDELSKVVAEIEKETGNEEIAESPLKEAATDSEEEEDPVLEAIIAGFGELEEKMNKFEEKLALVEQMYARLPQFENVDTQSQNKEVDHFTETSDQTAQEIQKEHNVDISTPKGRVELSLQPKENVTDAVTEEVQDGEDKEEDEESCEDCKNPLSKCSCLDDKDGEIKVEKLSGVQEKIFQNGICPITGETLVKSSKIAGDFLGIYSPNGGTEYAVNLNTGEIFLYKG